MKSNLYKHAETELKALYEGIPKDEWDRLMYDHVLALIKYFGRQGHSGASAPVAISLFSRLARYEALSPLTGKVDEWIKIGDDQWQNRRCSHVFMDEHGVAYDIDAIVFREKNGSCFTGRHSSLPIFFPYTPKTYYIDVEK